MADEAKDQIADALQLIDLATPGTDLMKPVEHLSPAEALARISTRGLHRLDELLSRPITDDMDLKEKRLIGDMALGATKLFARVAEGALRARGNNALEELLAEIRAAREKDAAAK